MKLKNIIAEIKHSVKGLNSRFELVEERISELKEIIQSEEQNNNNKYKIKKNK